MFEIRCKKNDAAMRRCESRAGRDPYVVDRDTKRAYNPLTWELVSEFEPLTCRLHDVRRRAMSVLAARMAQVIALTAPDALGLSGASSHETSHANGEKRAALRNQA